MTVAAFLAQTPWSVRLRALAARLLAAGYGTRASVQGGHRERRRPPLLRTIQIDPKDLPIR